MADYLIRPMQESDLDQVMAVEHSSFAVPWTLESLRGEIHNTAARYFVLTHDGVVRAYAGTWLIIDEGHITNIAVHESARRKGYGLAVAKAMIRAAVDVGVTYMTLEVRVSNAPAIALYKKLGFKKAGVRKKYYEDNGEDAHIMINDRLEQSLAKLAAVQE